MNRTVVLDNEAVQALLSVHHPKHSKVLAHVQVTAARKRKSPELTLVVPTAVRVEAGWDRTSSTASLANRLRVADVALDAHSANMAAGLRAASGLSVADAHIGAVIAHAAPLGDVTVITSDPHYIRVAAGDHSVTIAVV